MPHIADKIIVEGLLDQQISRLAPAFNTLANSTLSLVLTSNTVQYFDGATAGQIVKLPDATTLQNGHRFIFYNNSASDVVTVQDNSTVQLVIVPFTSVTKFILFDNTTAAGVWIVELATVGTANAIINYRVSSSTPFTTTSTTYVVVTGLSVTPIQGTYSIWYNGLATMASGNKTHHLAMFKAGTIIPESERYQDSAAASSGMIDSALAITQVNGTQAIEVRVYSDTGTSLSVLNRSLILMRIGS